MSWYINQHWFFMHYKSVNPAFCYLLLSLCSSDLYGDVINHEFLWHVPLVGPIETDSLQVRFDGRAREFVMRKQDATQWGRLSSSTSNIQASNYSTPRNYGPSLSSYRYSASSYTPSTRGSTATTVESGYSLSRSTSSATTTASLTRSSSISSAYHRSPYITYVISLYLLPAASRGSAFTPSSCTLSSSNHISAVGNTSRSSYGNGTIFVSRSPSNYSMSSDATSRVSQPVQASPPAVRSRSSSAIASYRCSILVIELVAEKASQFANFAQHDAHEFLSFLLDGLHEDLNRVKIKPLTATVEGDGRSDIDVSNEAWRNHTLRNDSIFVDLFHGQLKSRLQCPNCDRVSITFDPFVYLPVPFPKIKKSTTLYFWSLDPLLKPVKVTVQYSTDGTIQDLLTALSDLVRVPSKSLRLLEVFSHRIQKVFLPTDRASDICSGDVLYAFQVHDAADCNETVVELLIIQRQLYSSTMRYACSECGKSDGRLKACEACYNAYYCNKFSVDIFQPPQFSSEDNEPPVRDMSDNLLLDEKKVSEPLVLESGTYLSINWYNLRNGRPFISVESRRTLDIDVAKSEKLAKQFGQLSNDGSGDPTLLDMLHVEATKKLELYRLPPILIIQLKRFVYTATYQTMHRRSKDERRVIYPINSLDMSLFLADSAPNDQSTASVSFLVKLFNIKIYILTIIPFNVLYHVSIYEDQISSFF
uniref:ubiquitinyl hydrolase 1 n=1 Tax=Heterorhabditis bacteriophora TaxID=37862 RepID=A0A1I7WXG7_HETBA